LGVIDGDQVVHVCVVEPDRPLRFTTAVGARDHLYCTGLGKLLISELPESELASHLPPEPFPRFTGTTISTLDALRADGATTRAQGFAFDDGERSDGLRCVAVAVRIDGDCLAALSLSGPGGEFTSAAREEYAADLKRVADELARDPEFAAAMTQVRRSLQSTVSGPV
jgi:IclR family acetate operon transcriptional repressor